MHQHSPSEKGTCLSFAEGGHPSFLVIESPQLSNSRDSERKITKTDLGRFLYPFTVKLEKNSHWDGNVQICL